MVDSNIILKYFTFCLIVMTYLLSSVNSGTRSSSTSPILPPGPLLLIRILLNFSIHSFASYLGTSEEEMVLTLSLPDVSLHTNFAVVCLRFRGISTETTFYMQKKKK